MNPLRLIGRGARLCGLLLAVFSMSLGGCASPTPSPFSGTIVDLTHAFDADTIYWPTDVDGFEFEELFAGESDGGYYYAANRFSTAEHGGTHIDAPIHFAEGRSTVDQIPLDRLVGPGVVIDVSAAAAKDADYEVTRLDILKWESFHGPIPHGAIVLLYTGFSERWADRGAYLGTNRKGPDALSDLHFPGLHPDTARWLVAERSIGAIGLDTASIDTGQSTMFESHRILMDRDIPAFENLARLGDLPALGFHVVALPMKIRGGSGGPLRAIAILPNGGSAANR